MFTGGLNMKRGMHWPFVLLFACVILLLPGCNGKSAGGSASSGSNKEQVVTILINKDNPFAGAQAVIDALEKKTGIKTEIEIGAGGTEWDNQIKTRLATGDMTDIFMYNTGSLMQAINPERNILDITDEPWAAGFTDTFKKAASANSRLYATPYSTTIAGAIVYNKKIYQELGLQVPRTWKDFIANCDKIKAAGRTAIIASYKDSWTSQLIVLGDEYNVKAVIPNFPEEYTANRAKYASTPIAMRSFEKLAEVGKYTNRDSLATTYDIAIDMLVEGQGVHYPIVTSILGRIYSMYPDSVDNFGIFGNPGDDPNNHGLTIWMPDGWYIYKNSSNTDLAKKWLEFYVSQEGFLAYTSALKPDGPPCIKGLSLPADAYAGVKDMQEYFNSGKTQPALEFESPVKGPNLEQICIEVGTGITDPRTAAVAYDADVQKQAIQLNLAGW
jgi:raffinose/stachyose/melibiose transport system substrate-binding protein